LKGRVQHSSKGGTWALGVNYVVRGDRGGGELRRSLGGGGGRKKSSGEQKKLPQSRGIRSLSGRVARNRAGGRAPLGQEDSKGGQETLKFLRVGNRKGASGNKGGKPQSGPQEKALGGKIRNKDPQNQGKL